MKHLSREELIKHLNVYSDDMAVAHLFKVCTGYDSMILGEDEILGQVKEAYHEALIEGWTDYELNVLFRRAVTCSKRIKTDTRISSASQESILRVPCAATMWVLTWNPGRNGFGW